ncbi:MAG TPA: hypothetical protein VFT24_07470 [Vicinamibacterales bacterium]|nr:hypothetical protein [Vicinamibacterales bacterium]
MERPRPRSLRTRLKHASLFVAIVWALAGSFVAFDLVFLSATLANLEALGDVALPEATQQSTACKVGQDEATGQAGALAAPDAQADAWILGVRFGSNTQSRASSRDSTNVQSVSEIERLAGRLGVPVPGAFSPGQFANANTEFVTYVEADASGTAHRLAVRYSPEACQLYKLGAFWGYTMWIRVGVPGRRTAMAIPINYYARQAGLPEPLTRAMVTPASADTSRAERAAEAIALTEAVTKHLAGTQ